MIWKLRELIDHANSTQTERNEKWVPARPIDGPFIWRLKAAWAVLKGKADAFTWPEGQ